MGRVILAAGAIVRDASGRYLLVKRGKPPEMGHWTVPGGRLEAGETLADAAAREAAEETGLQVRVVREVGHVVVNAGEATGDAADVYEIHDFLMEPVGVDAQPVAGDDAADAAWFTPDELLALLTTTDLVQHLRRYGAYP